jgi:hypothetical protein
MQLVGRILCLHAFSKPKQAKLLLNGIQPFISMKRLFCLFKYGRLGVHEILKVAILVRLKSLTDIAAFAIDHLAHSIS